MEKDRTLLGEYFRILYARRAKAFMPYITAGFPSSSMMPSIIRMLRDGGADCLEIGVPFSDPVADGVTIQESTQKALEGGVTLGKALMWGNQAARLGMHVLLMGYTNVFRAAGLRMLASRMEDAGIQGLIVPDLPMEESKVWRILLNARKIALPLFVAPTTPRMRMARIGGLSTGFVYYVSVTGVTGERARLPRGVAGRLSLARRCTGKPVCVGFGVSCPSQAAMMARLADGVIVGSALVRRIANWSKSAVYRRSIRKWVESMSDAVHNKM